MIGLALFSEFFCLIICYFLLSLSKSIIYYLQVEALAVQLTQREGELMQEKEEVKKLANFLKQVILISSLLYKFHLELIFIPIFLKDSKMRV